jgi:hypothetical protein
MPRIHGLLITVGVPRSAAARAARPFDQSRVFLLHAVILCVAVLCGPAAAAPVADDETVRLGKGPHLLLDDQLWAENGGAIRRVNAPRRTLGAAVVTGPEDKNFQPYMTVLRDPDTGRFRIWYDVAVSGGQSHIATMESEDGVHWIRPHRVLEDPAKIVFGVSVLDEGRAFADPARRFKLAWWNGGLCIAHSRDGLGWTAESTEPRLTGINDILSIARDPIRARYLAVFGMPSRPEDGYTGKTANAREGYRRCVGQSTSTDAVHWEPARRIIAPDSKDDGITEFYSIGGVLARGDLLVGLLKVLRDDLPADPGGPVAGIGYTVLAWTRDGTHWERDRVPFFDRNPAAGSWDHAMAWMDYQLPVADELYLYYGGYARGHKVERFSERQIGLVRLPRDRYVAWEAGAGEATLRTRPVTLDAAAMTVNADASRGALGVQIEELGGTPIAGFAFADSQPVRGDALAAPLRWRRPLSQLRGKPVRIAFRLRDARLFAFDLE